MKLVTAEQMRQVDAATIDGGYVSGPDLMENAGRGIAEHILNHIMPSSGKGKVAVFCGKGNNGGDGYVVSRYLFQAGVEVTIYFMGPLEKLSADARLNFDRAVGLDMNLVEVSSLEALPEKLECDYIIDAIFGTGFSGAPRGLAAEIIEYINRQEGKTVISVDLPSGLNADTGTSEGAVIQANYTFPLALPKYGLYISPGRELAGDVFVVPIGIPDEIIERFHLPVDLTTLSLVTAKLPARKPDGHKGDFGKVFVLAGSTGLTGAAAMAAKSAYRSGCGLVKIGCPRTTLPLIAPLIMEATALPLPDVAKKGALALRCLGEVRKVAAEHDAVIIGPGLGTHHETQELVRRFLSKLDKPAIIDADGLNALVGHTELLHDLKAPDRLVLTPHPGEFKRLTGKTAPPESDIHERIATALTAAAELQCTLVLKGSPTLIAEPSGSCYLNPTGNNGMATGGSGDVLSGIIGSLLAQGLSALDAAVAGAYIHGLAGDIAADEITERSLIAGDMIDYLPAAFSLM